MRAIATINGNLHDMLARIRSSTENMATATHQIATGKADLSARTRRGFAEQNAALVEEAAAAAASLKEQAQALLQAVGIFTLERKAGPRVDRPLPGGVRPAALQYR